MTENVDFDLFSFDICGEKPALIRDIVDNCYVLWSYFDSARALDSYIKWIFYCYVYVRYTYIYYIYYVRMERDERNRGWNVW